VYGYVKGWANVKGEAKLVDFAHIRVTFTVVGPLGPIATDATYACAPGGSLRVPISAIAWDPRNNPLTVLSAGPGLQRAAVSFDNDNIFYQPANDNDDLFPCSVSNGSDTAIGFITVKVVPGGTGVVKSVAVVRGAAAIEFFGVPDVPYDVQRASTLTPPVRWITVNDGPLSPGRDGLLSFSDLSAPEAMAYYRSVRH
jgi:hypothetical protein